MIKQNPWKKLENILLADYKNWRKILNNFNKIVSNYFPNFKRYYPWELFKKNFEEKNIICWWDVDPLTWKIISSDDIFEFFVDKFSDKINKAIVLTDVDWVLDNKWNVINKINKNNLKLVQFWKKIWDVTWSMKAKVEKLVWKKIEILIINWYNINNLLNILQKNKWIYTKIS